jgi:hypothetical protein
MRISAGSAAWISALSLQIRLCLHVLLSALQKSLHPHRHKHLLQLNRHLRRLLHPDRL